ncbi:hypothetical protein BT63DRAFT_461255 [Microthyrium microscopicum]|uniref:Ubiquitin 3 binding protein But2 C-terminal domain-containing protein n=1 Tax=Microthyrium microscopicum TaxID=703497 RepID=A0A6A6TTY8_9PEZI|nr:hypothetical protein BT63DRAFT_461255 [Microthyrium microscopicum]
MVGIKTLSFAALAVGALAGPVATADASKAFKIGVTFPNKDTMYLTNSATASANIADGIACTITPVTSGDKTVGELGCGPDKKTFTYSELHSTSPLQPVAADKKNVNWSIGADNVIAWGALPAGTKSVTFSRIAGSNPNSIYAEVCSTFEHHEKLVPSFNGFWERGVAKAYYV